MVMYMYTLVAVFAGYSIGTLVAGAMFETYKKQAFAQGALAAFDRYAEVVEKANLVGSGPIVAEAGSRVSNIAIFAKDLEYGLLVDGPMASITNTHIENIRKGTS
jgi:hypothetical protein